MKILKKTLAVALVLVLALGMVPIMTGAIDYTDEAEIEYKEEVAVLTGIGVLEGYDAGTFQPGRNVTRAQACAIVARLLLTRDLADSLPVDSTGFKDVPATHWAANYIAFCVAEGIVVGYGDGRFGPNNDVKGSEFAIMIMRALGIGDAKRWEGANWQMFAILDGQGFDILTTGVNYTAPATREETAVYAFNGLFFSPSGQSTEMIYGIIKFNLVTLPDGTQYLEPEYGFIPVLVIAKDAIATAVYPSLTLVKSDFDDLGRPARVWLFGEPQKKPIYVAAVDPVTIIEGNVTQAALYTATGASGLGATAPALIKATVNKAGGQVAATLTSLRNETDTSNGLVYAVATTKDGTPNGSGSRGLGNITEIYKVGTEYIAVVIVPSFGQIESIDSEDAAGGIGAHTIYTIDEDNEGVIFTEAESPYDVDTVVIDGTVKKNDWVLYYQGEENLYISVPDTLTGVLSSITSAGVYTVDGESRRLAQAYTETDGGPPVASKEETTFYVDAKKNILGVAKRAATAAPIVFVFGVDDYNVLEDGKIVTKYFADVIDLDGKVSTVPVAKNGTDGSFGYMQLIEPTDTIPGTPPIDVLGNIGVPYLYGVNASGLYTFTEVDDPHVAHQLEEIENGSVTLTALSTLLAPPDPAVTNANNSTIFVVVNYEDGEPDGTVTLYNRNTVPDVVPEDPGDFEHIWAVSVGTDKPANQIANIVYIFDDFSETETSPFAFLLKAYTQTSASSRLYNMVVKGEIVTVTVPTAKWTDHEKEAGTLRDKVTDDPYSLGSVVSGSTPNVEAVEGSEVVDGVGGIRLSYNDGLLITIDEDGITDVIGAIEGDVPVYTFRIPPANPGTATYSTTDASALNVLLGADDENTDTAFVVSNEKDEITAIYVLRYNR